MAVETRAKGRGTALAIFSALALSLPTSALATYLPDVPATSSTLGTVKLGVAGGAAVYNPATNTSSAGAFSTGAYVLCTNGTADYKCQYSNFLSGQNASGLIADNALIQAEAAAGKTVAMGSQRISVGQFLGGTYNILTFQTTSSGLPVPTVANGAITFSMSITITAGSTAITYATPTTGGGPVIGEIVSVAGVPAGDSIATVGPGMASMKTPATATGSVTATFTAATQSTVLAQAPMGAVMSGTDNTGGFGSALAAVSANGGGTLFIPQGVWYISLSSVLALPAHSRLMGAGRDTTVLLLEDDTGSRFATACPFDDVEISNLTFRGTLDLGLSASGSNFPLTAGCSTADSRRFTMQNVGFRFTRKGTLLADRITSVNIDHSYFSVTNGGPEVNDSDDIDVGYNYTTGTSDDGWAFHSNDGVRTSARSVLLFHNNLMEDTQGFDAGGLKSARISGNTFRRMISYPIQIFTNSQTTQQTGQGNTPENDIVIDGNEIEDNWGTNARPTGRNQSNYDIAIACGMKAAGSAPAYPGDSTNSTPGTPDSAGNVTPFYGAVGGTAIGNVYTSSSVNVATPAATGPQMGCIRPEIINNHIVRTLPSVAAVSNWGYAGLANGQWMVDHTGAQGTFTYQPYNDPITETELSTPAIIVVGPVVDGVIAGNQINTGGVAVTLLDYAGLASGDVQWDIHDNTFRNCAQSAGPLNFGMSYQDQTKPGCINVDLGTHSSTVTAQRILIHENTFDGDPWFIARGGGASSHGAWTSATMLPGVFAPFTSGVEAENNKFWNVSEAVYPATTAGNAVSTSGALTVQDVEFHNTLHGYFTASGFSTSNKGIGFVPAPSAGYSFVWEQDDPTAAGYGQTLFAPPTEAPSIPTSGLWLAGQEVRSTSTTLNNGTVPLLYRRMTTGSGNVAGTDWLTVSAPAQ